MFKYTNVLAVLGIGLAALLGDAEMSNAQTSPVTAIDIALEPDATMLERAKADNARLLKVFPKGFALDATHHPHITMLQQFVRTLISTRFTPQSTRFWLAKSLLAGS
jgi:hypothetical protein